MKILTISLRAPLFIAVAAASITGCGKNADTGSAHLVISQVYGGGSGNAGANSAGAIYNADYVELFNSGSVATSLAGLSLQYARTDYATVNGGTTGWNVSPLPASATIEAGKYYLIQVNASAPSVGAALPTPDFITTSKLNYGSGSGVVALVEGNDSLTCQSVGAGTPCTSKVIDLVGYGVPNGSPRPPQVFEGSAGVAGHSVTTAMFRKNGGCTDTNDNANDFEIVTIDIYGVGPRNSATAARTCSSGSGSGSSGSGGGGGGDPY